jgi:hypothetical protein
MDERVLRAEASIELAENRMRDGQLALAFEAAEEGAVVVSGLRTPAAIRSGVEARFVAIEASLYLDDLRMAELLAQRARSGAEQILEIRRRVDEDEPVSRFVAGRGRVSDVLDPNQELDDHIDSQLAVRSDLMFWTVREALGDDRALQQFQRIAESCFATSATAPLGLLASRHVLSCAIYDGNMEAGKLAVDSAFEASRSRGSRYLGEWYRWLAAFQIHEGRFDHARQSVEVARELEARTDSVIGRVENLLVLAHLEYELGHEAVAVELLGDALAKAANLELRWLIGRPISAYV